VKVGDLVRYNGVEEEYNAIGLCLREEEDIGCDNEVRMLVMWFDDWQSTHEDLDICEKESYVEVISESR
tara:strand:+ start:713 stop:919 length:207 start_codon:yes stop_codon:yes gene_type:complete